MLGWSVPTDLTSCMTTRWPTSSATIKTFWSARWPQVNTNATNDVFASAERILCSFLVIAVQYAVVHYDSRHCNWCYVCQFCSHHWTNAFGSACPCFFNHFNHWVWDHYIQFSYPLFYSLLQKATWKISWWSSAKWQNLHLMGWSFIRKINTSCVTSTGAHLICLPSGCIVMLVQLEEQFLSPGVLLITIWVSANSKCLVHVSLNPCSLVMQSSRWDLCQHELSSWPFARQYQTITWTYVDLLPMVFLAFT